MPSRLLRPCSYPGCGTLTRADRCIAHPREATASTYQRDAATHRLYGRQWQRRRLAQLSAHPWCEDHLERGEYISAVDVHHEERHRGDPIVFARSRLLSLCKACHTIRTNKEKGEGSQKLTKGAM